MSTLNWRRDPGYEQRMKRLRSENARLAELDARIDALWPNSNSSSTQTPPPDNDSPT
ncbi:MAG: hypothetical protein K9J75_01050 [Cyanobium usitatum Tobar12.5m-G36]|nr:hypothetical protein [Cyanobium usitatum Tobar12.5m-G36]